QAPRASSTHSSNSPASRYCTRTDVTPSATSSCARLTNISFAGPFVPPPAPLRKMTQPVFPSQGWRWSVITPRVVLSSTSISPGASPSRARAPWMESVRCSSSPWGEVCPPLVGSPVIPRSVADALSSGVSRTLPVLRQLGAARVPVRELRVGVRGAEEQRLLEGTSGEVQADREAVREARRDADRRVPGDVRGDGVEVVQVHRVGVVELFAQPEGGAGGRGTEDHVVVGQGRLELPADEGAHLLRLQVVGVVVAGG